MKKETCKLVSFGLGGHLEYFKSVRLSETSSSKGTLQGYSIPERWKASEDVDYSDCLVLDLRPAVEYSPSYAFQSPLFDADLEDWDRGILPAPPAFLVQGISLEKDKTFLCLLALHAEAKATNPSNAGPLDQVSRPEYMAWWRIRGAKAGKIIDNKIVWD